MQIFDVSIFSGCKGVDMNWSVLGEEDGISLRFHVRGPSVFNERQAISELGGRVARAEVAWLKPQTDYWLVDLDLFNKALSRPVSLPWLKGKVRIKPALTIRDRIGSNASHLDGFVSITIRPIDVQDDGDLLIQSLILLDNNHVAAATAQAGGVLETHLRHLCSKSGLVVTGQGSISKYDGVIAQARNQGNVVYSATDSKSVMLWGGMRNDAAHDPGAFRSSMQDVRRMIEGIRDFISRTS